MRVLYRQYTFEERNKKRNKNVIEIMSNESNENDETD